MKNAKGNTNIPSAKQTKPPREVIPPIFTDIRKPTPILNKNEEKEKLDEKKEKKIQEILQLSEEFPDWPNQEELEVKIINKTKIKYDIFI